MKVVVGLGNPGARYANTYHNIGMLFIEWFLESTSDNWQKLEKADYVLYKNSDKFVIIPNVYMNTSFKAIKPLVSMSKIPLINVLVVHDELTKKFGTLNVKIGGGNAGHNGLRSITEHLGNDFGRLQIGIDHPKNLPNYNGSVSDYVLSKIPNLDAYKELFEKSGKKIIHDWLFA